MEYKWPLMRNNIDQQDLQTLIDFLQTDPRLTQSANVREFEEKWSEWLGVKYSVFVNSGSSANLITIAGLRHQIETGRLSGHNMENAEIIVSPLGWSSVVTSVLHAGFKPVFADIDLATLSMNTEAVINSITENTVAVLLVHAQGFSALSEKLLDTLQEKDILLIEDVCESHGAKYRGQKLGSFGFASNFSFYFAHHMSTIEGGMVSTNDPEFYQLMRMMRSHGMVREATCTETRKFYSDNFPDLNEKFIFSCTGYNVRNTELGGVIGLAQLPKLDHNCRRRAENLKLFLSQLDNNKFFTDFALEDSSNYALPIIMQEKDDNKRDLLQQTMDENSIEYRRGNAGGGNQMRQPYMQRHLTRQLPEDLPVTEHVHFYGYYIGNYPGLTPEEISELTAIINKAF